MFKLRHLILSSLLLAPWASAADLPQEARVPGGIALLPLTKNTDAPQAPGAWYRGDRLLVTSTAGTELADKAPWVAVVGIPLSAKPGKAQHIRANGVDYYFEIEDKEYPAQYLTVKNKRHVNPDPADIVRWKRESAEMKAAFTNWQALQDAPLQFEMPVQGRFSSAFGLKRFFNEQARKPHSGLDIAAPKGTPITAPAQGVVTATGHYFFNGKTVILDHGNGLTSMYCHMNEITVKKGDQLKAGDMLGKVGTTGRSTGPHLHWSVSLNNTRVDPLLFVEGKR